MVKKNLSLDKIEVYCENCEDIFTLENIYFEVSVFIEHGDRLEVSFASDNIECPECGKNSGKISKSISNIHPLQINLSNGNIELEYEE
ncbi:MAG: hypothetical protein ACOCP8_06180 [archaeon]